MHGQLQQLRDAFAEAPDLEAMLENPEIDSRVKADVLARVAAGSDEIVVNFLRLIAEKGRAERSTRSSRSSTPSSQRRTACSMSS